MLKLYICCTHTRKCKWSLLESKKIKSVDRVEPKVAHLKIFWQTSPYSLHQIVFVELCCGTTVCSISIQRRNSELCSRKRFILNSNYDNFVWKPFEKSFHIAIFSDDKDLNTLAVICGSFENSWKSYKLFNFITMHLKAIVDKISTTRSRQIGFMYFTTSRNTS